MLFLATFTTHTTHSPGDDGMRTDPPVSVVRLVEARDEKQAEELVRKAYDKFEQYSIHVVVEKLNISGVLREESGS